jgi:FkbM family methyltransferase
MKSKDNIFDVGAFDGLDGLILAIQNPNMFVHAFEANPDLIKVIIANKNKIEKYKKIKINNYKVNNYAVSDKNDNLIFNIAKNPTVSSLNEFSKNIDKTWPGYREAHCTVIKKIEVKAITLEKYCNDQEIRKINYLHIDTQGSDLDVLRGLKNKLNIVDQGVLEATTNENTSLYENNHTINDVKNFLQLNNFEISKIENVDKNIDKEKNIYFNKKNLNSDCKINKKYNIRYYNRLINNRLVLKDRVLDRLKDLFFVKPY